MSWLPPIFFSEEGNKSLKDWRGSPKNLMIAVLTVNGKQKFRVQTAINSAIQ